VHYFFHNEEYSLHHHCHEEVCSLRQVLATICWRFAEFIAASQDHSFRKHETANCLWLQPSKFCVEKFGTERMQTITKEEITTRLEHQKKKLTAVPS
jgi:hypothetical protein